jgi:hypothetical protein
MVKFVDGRFNKEIANQIIEYLIQKYNINITKKRFVSAIGKANIINRHIRIPVPHNPLKFLVSLHEIGHVVMGFGSKLYITEYKAEMFAINTALEYGLDKHYVEQYEKMAKGYVLRAISKGYNHGLKLNKLNPKIISWLGYNDFHKWENKKVTIIDWETKDIEIFYEHLPYSPDHPTIKEKIFL